MAIVCALACWSLEDKNAHAARAFQEVMPCGPLTANDLLVGGGLPIPQALPIAERFLAHCTWLLALGAPLLPRLRIT